MRVEDHRLDRGGHEQAVRAVLGLRAEVECHPIGIRGVPGDHHQLRGAGDPVDPDLAGELALRLLDVAVAGPGDHVDRFDRVRSERERGDRLRAADRVDLVRAGHRGRRQGHVGDRPREWRPRPDPPRRPSPGCSPSARWRGRRRCRRARRSRPTRRQPRGSRRSGPGSAPPGAHRRAAPRRPRGCCSRPSPWRRGSRGPPARLPISLPRQVGGGNLGPPVHSRTVPRSPSAPNRRPRAPRR